MGADNMATCCEGKTGHCMPPSPAPQCDTSACTGCSGEQCQYCREEKERDCCLDRLCKDEDDGEKCKADNMVTCCEGKTGHCMPPSPAPQCDTSGCTGCSGEQCQYCR